MLERINGHSYSGILGYFYGKNSLVSIAVGSAGGVSVKDTGAVSSFVELKRFLNTESVDTIVAYLNERNIVRVNGSKFVAGSLEADYTKSYAAQTNVKRLVDIIQQRGVVLSTSDIASGVAVSGFRNAPSGVIAENASVAAASVITFLVERANVYDKDGISMQGVPSAVIEQGRNLIDDLTNVPMMKDDGSEVKLISSATAADAGNFAIKIYYAIPALSI